MSESSSVPYLYKEILDDPAEMEQKRANLRTELKEYEDGSSVPGTLKYILEYLAPIVLVQSKTSFPPPVPFRITTSLSTSRTFPSSSVIVSDVRFFATRSS